MYENGKWVINQRVIDWAKAEYGEDIRPLKNKPAKKYGQRDKPDEAVRITESRGTVLFDSVRSNNHSVGNARGGYF